MKLKIYKTVFVLFIGAFMLNSCTKDFDEYNTVPALGEASGLNPAYFVSTVVQKTFVHGRYSFWRGQLIHADRFADHVRFGFNGSWWGDGLGYEYHNSYTNAYWGQALKPVAGNANELLRITGEGGYGENQYLHAVGLISRALFYQRLTDTFGDIPFSQAGNLEYSTPAYDDQRDIYINLLADLNTAIDAIGSASVSSEDPKLDLAAGDLLYGGDLQKWKALANTLRLRMALRAYGANGADFAAAEVAKAFQNPLIDMSNGATINPDMKNRWDATSYTSIWWDFSWTKGSRWTISKSVVDLLRNNDDPRLPMIATPAEGGEIVFNSADITDFNDKWAVIEQTLNDAGVNYTTQTNGDEFTITMDENTHYVGQPARFSNGMYDVAHYNFWSKPTKNIIGNGAADNSVRPIIVLSSAESYFLQAEAVLRGISGASGSAQDLYQSGIEAAMVHWGVSAADIGTFMASSPAATLTGTTDEKLGQVASQRWLAGFTDGFEAWAVMRKSGYPKSATTDIPNTVHYNAGSVGVGIPYRMRYPSSEYDTNAEGVEQARQRQGEDLLATKTWWAK